MVHLERIAIAAFLLLYAFGGYFFIGHHTDPAAAASLATPLDARIPFIAESIYFYAAVYVLITLPIFVVDSPALFRRAALAYAAVATVSLLSFRLFPVSGLALRPALDAVEASAFVVWGLRLNYGLDPPVNLFPSLHLAGATTAMLSAWKARPAYGAVAALALVPVAISVCTVKQHFWIDALAGVALAAAAYAVLLHRFRLPPGQRGARGPASLVAFGAFLATAYLALYLAFRAGIEPWRP